jgi:type IV secretion system protein VirB5
MSRQNAIDNPYVISEAIWDDRLGTARAQVFRWQLVTGAAIGLAAFALLGWYAAQQKSQVQVYVAEVQAHGETRITALPDLQNYTIKQASYNWQASEFITLWRSLSVDKRVVQQNWLKAYAMLTPRAQNLFRELMREEKPEEAIGQKEVQIKITSIAPSSEQSLDVQWLETTLDKNLNKISVKPMRGMLTFLIQTPRTKQALDANPLGLWIDYFSATSKEG